MWRLHMFGRPVLQEELDGLLFVQHLSEDVVARRELARWPAPRPFGIAGIDNGTDPFVS